MQDRPFDRDEEKFPIAEGLKIGKPGEAATRSDIDAAIAAYLGPRHSLASLKRDADRHAAAQAAKARQKTKARKKGREAKASRKRNRR